MQLWLRIGNSSDYESFGDDFSAVADALADFNIVTIDQTVPSGFEAPGFYGHDYVSCYWGDDDSNLVQQLDTEDWAQLKACMRQHTRVEF